MNLTMQQKQTRRQREETCGCQGGGYEWEDWGQWMQTITFRMNKQGGPTVQHSELYSVSQDRP